MRKRNLKTVVKTMTDEDEAHLFEAKRAFERLVDPNVGVDPYHDVLTDEEVDQRNFEWRVRRVMTPERYRQVWQVLEAMDELDELLLELSVGLCPLCQQSPRHLDTCPFVLSRVLREQLPRPGEAHEG